MGIEYKSVAVGGVSEVKDEGDGVITAFVSVTGVEDNVKDIIEPGAYKKTLIKRTPKGVWGHSWTTPTSKTLSAKELPPGSPELPKQLSNGEPWPKEAGALKIKMQFNLGTTRGREAYSDVKFFGPQQEWSIGYTVPPGASYKDDNGVRHIKELDLFEYSAVLFGAMSHARTSSVADAQIGQKLLDGISALEVKTLEEAVALHRKEVEASAVTTTTDDFVGDEADDDASADGDEYDNESEDYTEPEDEEDEEVEEEDEEEEQEKVMRALMDNLSVKDLRDFYVVVGKVLDALGDNGDDTDYLGLGMKALVEAKATGFDTVSDAVAAIDVTLDTSDAKVLQDSAAAFDSALAVKDVVRAEQAAVDLFDVLEKVMDTTDDDDLSLKSVARTVADKAKADDDEEEYDDESDDEEEDDWEESDDDQPDNKKKSFTYISAKGIEYKSAPFAGREFGMPRGAEDLDAKERVGAFVANLPNDALVAMDTVLDDVRGNGLLKAFAADEIESRLYAGNLSKEEKLAIRRSVAGQQGRGGGRHVQASTGKTPGPGRNFGETGAAAKPPAKRLKKAVKGVKKPGVGKRTVNVVSGSKKPVQRMATESKRDFNASKRRKLASTGAAMPDESFPIENAGDLKNAIKLCGHAKDKDAAKAHIKKRAKALGLESMLPDEWKTAVINMAELKSLESYVRGVS